MTITPFTVYLVMQLDAVRGMLAAAILVLIVVSVFLVVIGACMDFDPPLTRSSITKIFVALAACGVLAAVIPSTKTAAAMIVLPHMLNNEQVQQFPAELLDYLYKVLDDERDAD